PGDVAELERADAVVLQVLAEIAPFLEQRDGGALVVLEGQHRADARRRIVAQLALDALLLQLLRHRAEIGVEIELERQRGAALDGALAQLDGEQADLRGEEGAVLLALGENEAHDVGVVVDQFLEVGRFEGGVADASGFDHGAVPWGAGRGINHRGGTNSRASLSYRCATPAGAEYPLNRMDALERRENLNSRTARSA